MLYGSVNPQPCRTRKTQQSLGNTVALTDTLHFWFWCPELLNSEASLGTDFLVIMLAAGASICASGRTRQ